MSKAMRSNLLLLLTALIWGVAFVAQSVGMDYVGPFTFIAARSIIAGLFLLPVIYLMDRRRGISNTASADSAASKASSTAASPADSITAGVMDTSATLVPAPGEIPAGQTKTTAGASASDRKALILGGILTGLCLAVASALQQIGIVYTTVGKAGFLTAMYILIVPILGLFFRKKVRLQIWISVALAVLGMYLLCMTDGFGFSVGDGLEFLCAVGYSCHILVIDHFSPKVDGVRMSCIQFWVCGLGCAVAALIFEQPDMGAILAAWMPILYAGALSSGVGYTLQIVAQKDTDPVIASLLMSLESTFSLLAGWVILGQTLSGRELTGCLLMFAAIMLAQIPIKRFKRS